MDSQWAVASGTVFCGVTEQTGYFWLWENAATEEAMAGVNSGIGINFNPFSGMGIGIASLGFRIRIAIDWNWSGIEDFISISPSILLIFQMLSSAKMLMMHIDV